MEIYRAMQPGRTPFLSIARANRLFIPILTLILATALGCQGDVESRLAEIRSLQAAGQFEASIEPLRGLVTPHSSHPEVNFRLGLALARTGRKSLSIWPLQKAATSEEHGIAAGILLINALLHVGDFEDAVRAADRILAIEPDNKLALYSRGRANISASKPQSTLEDADYLLSLDPEDMRALTLRSAALADLERVDEAEAVQRELERVAAEGSDDAQAGRACAARGVLLARTAQPDRASETFRECLDNYPSNTVVRNQATNHFVEVHAFHEAVATWRAAVEEQPEDGALRVRLAELLRQDGKPDEGLAVLAEMVELFDSAAAWRALASFLRSLGNAAEAREALEEAIERTPGDTAGLRFELGDLLVEEGDLAVVAHREVFQEERDVLARRIRHREASQEARRAHAANRRHREARRRR